MWLNHPRKGYIMEKSNKKLANTVLYYVIGLCLAVIIAVTLMTASSKKAPPVSNVNDETTEAVTDQTQSRTERVSSDSTNVEDSNSTEANTQTAASELQTTEKETKPTVSHEDETYSSPVNGYIYKEYTVDIPVYSVTMNDYRAHTGVDFVCEEGTAVASCGVGKVKSIYNHPMMGTTVVIEHSDGVCSHYMNLSETLPPDINVGAPVTKGQLIGAVGSTAIVEVAQEPHLHFEMTVAGACVDPMTLLEMSTVTVMSDEAFE